MESKENLKQKKSKGVIKYLVQWKRFTVEYDSWKKEEDLENVKKAVAEFKRRLNVEIQR